MVKVRPLTPDDWPTVAAIYAEGIAGRLATFETAVPGWEEWDAAHPTIGWSPSSRARSPAGSR